MDRAGIKRAHAYTMWRKLLKQGATEVTPDTMPGLPKALYALVASEFALVTSEVLSAKTSADGSTTKMLTKLQVSGLPSNITREGGQSLVIGGPSLVILE